jgi:hypothetical protein
VVERGLRDVVSNTRVNKQCDLMIVLKNLSPLFAINSIIEGLVPVTDLFQPIPLAARTIITVP